MEMTLSRLGLTDMRAVLTSTVLPIGILALIAMMVLPLPAFLLDIFFVGNIWCRFLFLWLRSTRFVRLISLAFPHFC